jgi:hypothetical protein
MLSIKETNDLTKIFEEMYKNEPPLRLLSILTDVDEFLNKENALIRRLAFCDDNWRFRAELKLRKDVIQAEIRRR